MAVKFKGHKLGENCESVVMWCGMQTDHLGGCVSICIHTHLHVHIRSIHIYINAHCARMHCEQTLNCELQSSHIRANTSPLTVSSLRLFSSSIMLTISILLFIIVFAFTSNSVLSFLGRPTLGSGGVTTLVELEHLSCDCHDYLLCVLHGALIE